MSLQLVALVAATLFTGAALYITLVEHPARMHLDNAALLAQWQPSYKRALPIQSGLAIVAGLAGLVAWYVSWDWRWLAGGAVMLANWPFTLLAIAPVNKRLMAMQGREAGAESRAMLIQWGRLHNVRSALGAASTVLFLLGFAAST
ncbi:DUF1772 domain-containing protein [Chelativorans sp.]|uniref:DUF1772 domain-containing protein n=1 Tax=Chelativorans sp. TaxID=2203393 RepID=UPI002811C2B4|nr:DUF1772 domain-containing protein [Chelativorans sp.]